MQQGDSTPPRSFEPADLVGTVFADHYRIERLVSTGANTAIYDATDRRNGRTVTLKLIRPKLSASPSFRTKFDETMRAVAALSHPNIAAVYDWGIAPTGDISAAYVVNEYLSGGSLRDLFDRGRRLTPSQALAVGLDTCRALDHAHRRGFVHTELSPSKIVFGDDRRLRVIDFGLARLLGEPVWERPDAVPTHVAWYAAPEQGLGQAIDGRADVYALCLSLHEAVTGTLPFHSDSTVAALAARVGRLMPVSADLGPLASVLERAGRPEADERSTAGEFGKGLLQVASKLPRPEPLPLLAAGLFDTPLDQLRSPDDPTGGVTRRPVLGGAPSEQAGDDDDASAPGELLVVPLDEPVQAAASFGVGEHDRAPDTVPDNTLTPFGGTEPVVASAGSGGVPPAGGDGGVDAAAGHDGGFGSIAHDSTDALVILPIDTPVAGVAGAGDRAPEPIRRRRRFPWKLVWALLVLGALAGLAVLALQLFEKPTHVVPELTGQPEAAARNLIAPFDWEIAVDSERSDEVADAGAVVRTAPGAGVELAEGEPFLIVVSEGPLLRTLPEANGRLLSEIQTELAALPLGVAVVEEHSEDVPAGTVIRWSVPGDPTLAAGAQVEPMTPVELVVSTGPAPRQVPDLIGLTTVDAGAGLNSLGLTLAEVGREFSDEIPLGSIVSQSVAAGELVERGAEITVIVSRGPDLVTFPDISAAGTYEAAAALLVEAGFVPELTFGDAQGAIRSVTIDGDPPEVGTTYRRGTVVTFEAL